MATHQSGVVTLSCLPTAAFYFLPSVIRDYNNHYPNIRIRILEHSAKDCLEAVLNGDADFGINMINITHPNIDFSPLVNEPFVLACRRDHELAQKSLILWEDLANFRLIGVRRSSGNRSLIDQALENMDWKPNWFYEVRHLSTSLGMVEAGLGVAVVPSLAMPTDEHHILVSRPLVEPVIRRTLGLVLRRETALSPAAGKVQGDAITTLVTGYKQPVDREIYPLKPFSSSALYRQTLRKGAWRYHFQAGTLVGQILPLFDEPAGQK